MVGKVVLITGCSSGGIGFQLCEEFAERGCKVYATARRLESMEGFTHSDIEKLRLDITDDANVKEVVKTVAEREGRIDILINNAGILHVGPVVEAPFEEVYRMFETNVFGALRMCQAVFPYMAPRRSGTIVNVGTLTEDNIVGWQGLYSMSKASLARLSEILFLELRSFNISVVHVNAGLVFSNVTKNALGSFGFKPDTLYGAWRDTITDQVNIGQTVGAIPVEDFARHIAGKVLKDSPPRYVRYGGLSWLGTIMNLLPRRWALEFMWRFTAGKPKQPQLDSRKTA